jgi:pyroglutamyl-peptidase
VILVTGFEPWGKHKTNPSGDLARELGGVVLPTEYRASERALLAAVRRHRPKALVMLGLAESRKKICVEMVALNFDHADIRDNARERRQARRIARGPLALETRLPAKRLFAALKAARVPAALSFHAGTFCCNHVFYVALSKLRVPCGFVHVPLFKTVPKAVQLRGVRRIMEALS